MLLESNIRHPLFDYNYKIPIWRPYLASFTQVIARSPPEYLKRQTQQGVMHERYTICTCRISMWDQRTFLLELWSNKYIWIIRSRWIVLSLGVLIPELYQKVILLMDGYVYWYVRPLYRPWVTRIFYTLWSWYTLVKHNMVATKVIAQQLVLLKTDVSPKDCYLRLQATYKDQMEVMNILYSPFHLPSSRYGLKNWRFISVKSTRRAQRRVREIWLVCIIIRAIISFSFGLLCWGLTLYFM